VATAEEALAHGDDSRAKVTACVTERAHEYRRTDGIETTLPTFTAKSTT
jgi:hypothetical protein